MSRKRKKRRNRNTHQPQDEQEQKLLIVSCDGVDCDCLMVKIIYKNHFQFHQIMKLTKQSLQQLRKKIQPSGGCKFAQRKN